MSDKDKDIRQVSSVDARKKVIQTDNIQAEIGEMSTVSNEAYVLAAIMTRFAWELDKKSVE